MRSRAAFKPDRLKAEFQTKSHTLLGHRPRAQLTGTLFHLPFSSFQL